MTTWGDGPPEREPDRYVTELWCLPADDGRHQLHARMKDPEPERDAEPEPGT